MLKKAAGLTRPIPARRGRAGEKSDFFSILLDTALNEDTTS